MLHSINPFINGSASLIASQDVTNWSKEFPLNGTGPINVVEYTTFTPAATGGTVVVQMSPDN